MDILLILSALLLCDAFFDFLLARPLLPFYPFQLLTYIWLLAFLKFLLLFGVAERLCGKLKAAPRVVRTVHLCLLVNAFTPPVYETVKCLIFRSPVEIDSGLFPSLKVVLALGVACWFWECAPPGEFCARPNKKGKDESAGTKRALTSWEAIGRLWQYSKDDMAYLVGAFLFLTLAAVGEMFIPYYTGKIIDILGSKYREADFYAAIFLMSVFSVASSLSAGCRGGLFMFTFARLTQRLRALLFKAVVRQEINFFESTKTGEIASRLSTDTAYMNRSIAANLNIFLRSAAKAICTCIFLLDISWQLTLLTFLDMLITGLLQSVYNYYNEELVKKVQDSIAQSTDLAGEVVSAIRTVRSYATEVDEAKRFDAALLKTHRLKTQQKSVQTVYLLVRRITQLSAHVGVLYFGKYLIQTGTISSGHLVSFILYQQEATNHIRSMVHMYGEMVHSVGAAEKVFEYLDRSPRIVTDGTLKPDTIQGHIQLKNVTFSYPSRPDVPVLQDVSFELKPGKITALVGPSGGGKTTCVSLLERFYEPQVGQILLDGCEIGLYDHKYLHSQISLVAQEPVLFTGTIKENITYGMKDIPMSDVINAAEAANADQFIQSMEKNYQTEAGEQGSQLAGGQKQRIAIARALVRHPHVLILDEASSCLDVDTEQKVQTALSRIPGLTVLVIAHRLKSVEKADRIIVMEGGQVVEEGNHQQLLEKEGLYYGLVQKRFLENGTSDEICKEHLEAKHDLLWGQTKDAEQ